MQPWTSTLEFLRMNMEFMCMCVKFNYITMDYPLPKSIVGLFICIPMGFATVWRVSYNRGRPRIVCVHGYT